MQNSSYPASLTTPWQHQIDAWNLAKNFHGYYIAHDMGAGKSKTAIDYINGVDARHALIICPSKVIPVWPGQFKRHSYGEFNILEVTKKVGSSTKKAKAIFNHIEYCDKSGQKCVVVINYESCWRESIGPVYNNSGRITDVGLLLKYRWDVIVPDESHRIKAPGGKASWMLKRLHKVSDYRLPLSGTPMPHSPLDIYAQFRAMDPSIFGTNFTLFKNRYCIMGGYDNRQIIEWINQDELKEKFFSRAHYVHADDCLDLPDKQDITVPCDLDPKTLNLYRELDSEFVAGVDNGTITVQNSLDKLLRLAQIAGGYLIYEHEDINGDTFKKERIIDNSKIDTTIELIKDLPPHEPIVIFFRFVNEIERMKKAIEKTFKTDDTRRVCEISGRISQPVDFVDGVWQAKTTDTALVQIQAGGEGIDLTAARYCFYFSMGFSLGQYRQSRRRVRRPGQTRKVFYYHIVARATVDRKIMRAIEDKKKIINSILMQTKHGLGKSMSMSEAPDLFN